MPVSAEAERGSCGNCANFDTKNVKGESFGSIKAGDTKLIMGVCRAPLGLLIGHRTHESKCTKPASYSARNEKNTPVPSDNFSETILFTNPKPEHDIVRAIVTSAS